MSITADPKIKAYLKKQELDYFKGKFISRCENLAEGELHIIKIGKQLLCFDVNEAHTFYKLHCDSGVEGEFTAMLHPNDFRDYEIGVFYYPNEPSKSFLQLFYLEKDMNEGIKVEDYNGFTISEVK